MELESLSNCHLKPNEGLIPDASESQNTVITALARTERILLTAVQCEMEVEQ